MDVGGFGSHFSSDRGAQGRGNAAHFKDLGDEEPAEKAGRSRRRPFIEVPYWEKQSKATWTQIVSATDTVSGSLWNNGNRSFHGTNDKVTEENLPTHSLLLIKPARLDLIVGKESQYIGASKKKVRAKFEFNSIEYKFVVTDPWIETKYFAGNDGTYAINGARLCISLAELLYDDAGQGHATKLVAAVITQDRVEEGA